MKMDPTRAGNIPAFSGNLEGELVINCRSIQGSGTDAPTESIIILLTRIRAMNKMGKSRPMDPFLFETKIKIAYSMAGVTTNRTYRTPISGDIFNKGAKKSPAVMDKNTGMGLTIMRYDSIGVFLDCVQINIANGNANRKTKSIQSSG
jgi:hypothetical protein